VRQSPSWTAAAGAPDAVGDVFAAPPALPQPASTKLVINGAARLRRASGIPACYAEHWG